MSLTQQAQDVEDEKILGEIPKCIAFPMALKSAIELGILDILSGATNHGAYLSASEVASKIPGCVNPNASTPIECILSLLTSFSILKCKTRSKLAKGKDRDGRSTERVYVVAPTCKYFLANEADGSMASFHCLMYDTVSYQTWSNLNEAIREGGTAFEKAHDMKLYEYAKKDPRRMELFNYALSGYTTIVMKKILGIYQGFEGLKVLVDVGGGFGSSIHLITSKYPQMKGINFDLPHVVADGASKNPGVEHIGGDMFQEVPKGDAIFLKWILHNWDDLHCVELLKNCWKALPKKGKVIVMEKLLPLTPENNLESQVLFAANLGMYANFCALERTIEDFKVLAFESGFLDCRVICSTHNNWIIEFDKV